MAKPEVQNRSMALDEFVALPEEDAYRLELFRGSLVREPAPGMRHGHLALRIAVLLRNAAEEDGRGLVLADTGFVLNEEPPTVRVPDVAFVSKERLPEGGIPEGFGDGAPDLAVEVVSPSNSASDLQQKALDYLDAGGRIVWLVDPAKETATVLRSRSDIAILQGNDALEGGDVIPGLRIPLTELFG